MLGELSLNGPWELGYSHDQPGQFHGERVQHRSQFQAQVPEPVHQTLLQAGVIDDPNFGLNSLKSRWVEEMYWVYRRHFTAPVVSAETKVWLVCDKLEMDATIYLNGVQVGEHHSAHRPARIDITKALRAGENLLIVQLDAGLFNVADKAGVDYSFQANDLLTKRHWQRKPQYQVGWDWSPRLMNVGILGDIRLQWSDVPLLQQLSVFAVPTDDLKSATFEVRATVLGIADTDTATLTVRLPETGQEVSTEITVPRGESRHTVILTVDNPTLWWPRGYGDQHMYQVEVTLTTANGDEEKTTRRTGVRLVEVDQSRHPVTGDFFIVNINHVPVFCKGGNWVPAELLYSTVTPERYRALIQLAVDANFNTMRIWGGGLFADHAFCDACDEAGLLIWHDLLFACSKYPADIPRFAAEARREVRFGMRELAHHPALIIWCGNNEIAWGDADWGWDKTGRTHPHYYLFHRDFPLIAREEDPSKFYWVSS
ncbi:MAG: sugar-binding domain-containing protein, partial [bacterium]